MNTTIWIIQAVLAIVFTASGLTIFFLKKKLKSKLSWLNAYSPTSVNLICVAKILGGIGLIIPSVTGILPILTPLAAIGIAIIMALAFSYHIGKREYKDLPTTVLFFIMALFIAYERL